MTRTLRLGSWMLLPLLAMACGSDDTPPSGTGGTAGSAGEGGRGQAGSAPGGTAGTAGSGGAAGSGGSGAAGGSSAAGASGEPDYANADHWLCLPGRAGDPCAESLDATSVAADGSTETEAHVADPDAPVDCFYVYPTISGDPTVNSDLVPGPEETNVVKQQAARLTSVCRLYAPMYRQVTLAALFGSVTSDDPPELRREIAYGDVLAAWEHYLATHNDGRGVVLIGHSQGAGILRRLIQERIDGEPLQSQLVAAYLVGTAVAVPEGADVGGDFTDVPACRAVDQTGCVVSYASYAADAPPPDDSLFGAPRTEPGVALCVNPASPAGGAAALSPYWSSDGALLDVTGLGVTDPYVTFPGLLTGECVVRNGFSILEVSVSDDPADVRFDTLDGRLAANWGLHLIDLHLTMGDVVRLVASQRAAYLGE
jgi:hypothetical protein